MKRKGFILMEVLLALLLLSALAAAVFPILGQTMGAAVFMAVSYTHLTLPTILLV